MKELAVEYSFAYTPAEFQATLNMIDQNLEDVARLITSRVPLQETGEAFTRLSNAPTEIKVLIKPS